MRALLGLARRQRRQQQGIDESIPLGGRSHPDFPAGRDAGRGAWPAWSASHARSTPSAGQGIAVRRYEGTERRRGADRRVPSTPRLKRRRLPAGRGPSVGRRGVTADNILPRLRRVIFKAVGEGRPYPDHGYTTARQWSEVAPRQVRLDELVTTKRTLDLAQLLSEDSTFYGDLFAHVVQWRDTMYLEDGLHRAVRAALAQRPVLHARVLVLAD
jgi:Arc/MetJ family transcription regulator